MNGRRLYDEIGGVNERYLQEAATYRARRKAPVWRAMLIAAVLALVGTLLIGTLAMSVGIGLVGSWILDAMQPSSPDVPAEPEQYTIAKMESVMQNKQYGLQAVPEEKLHLFGSNAQLIWTDGASGEYYRVTLSEQEFGNLLYLMQARQVEITEDSEQPSYKVWISFGDGTVVSPYLKTSQGNTGHGALFDYDPELELSEDLIKQIVRCIET